MKKILILVLLVAVLAGGWWALHRRHDTGAPERKEQSAAQVETARIEEKVIAQTIQAFGIVASAPSGDRVVSAPFECVVTNVIVAVGARVAAGDVLIEVAPSPDTRLAYESARSALALANRSLAAAQERFDLKLATQSDLLAAQQAAEEARLKAASFEARGLGRDGKITAKEEGVVSKLEVSAGALIAPGTALVTVSTGGQFECRLAVEASDLASLAPGQPVTLQLSNRSGAEHVSATIRTVGASLDPVSGAADVRVTVPVEAALLLGEHVRAFIETKKKEHALVVPPSAVLPMEDKQVLFTVRDGKAVKHEVTLGLVADDAVEVIGENLHAGDVVVILGNYELENGAAVQVPEAEVPVTTTPTKEPRS